MQTVGEIYIAQGCAVLKSIGANRNDIFREADCLKRGILAKCTVIDSNYRISAQRSRKLNGRIRTGISSDRCLLHINGVSVIVRGAYQLASIDQYCCYRLDRDFIADRRCFHVIFIEDISSLIVSDKIGIRISLRCIVNAPSSCSIRFIILRNILVSCHIVHRNGHIFHAFAFLVDHSSADMNLVEIQCLRREGNIMLRRIFCSIRPGNAMDGKRRTIVEGCWSHTVDCAAQPDMLQIRTIGKHIG